MHILFLPVWKQLTCGHASQPAHVPARLKGCLFTTPPDHHVSYTIGSTRLLGIVSVGVWGRVDISFSHRKLSALSTINCCRYCTKSPICTISSELHHQSREKVWVRHHDTFLFAFPLPCVCQLQVFDYQRFIVIHEGDAKITRHPSLHFYLNSLPKPHNTLPHLFL